MKLRIFLLPIVIMAFVSACAHLPAKAEREKPRSVVEASKFMDEVYAPAHLWKKRAGRYKMPTDPEKAWEWFLQRRRDLRGHTPIDYREKALAHSRRFNRPIANNTVANWTLVGPVTSGTNPPSGRIIDLAVNPTNEQIIYAATASGGVWKTTDQGANWSNLTDNKIPTLGCGSILMDPANPDTLYVGLGEGMTGSGLGIEPLGTGIYKTTDGGGIWNLVPNTGNGAMQFVVDIRFGGNANTLLVAATGGPAGAGSGLFRTIDGGANWATITSNPTWSISVDPTNASNVVITTQEFDQGAGAYRAKIYRSTDGGATLGTEVYNALTGFRIELARSLQTPGTLYALVGDQNSSILSTRTEQGQPTGIIGILKSIDGGGSWNPVAATGVPITQDFYPGQMTYNNCIVVDPADSNKVFFGSNLRPYKSTNGGTNFAAFADWSAADGLPFVHADHHAYAFGANSNTIYMGTDGGFFVSLDGGVTWQERNNGMVVTQIYKVSNHPTVANSLIMGCQDNDKFLRKPDGSWHHYPNSFGDCMEVEAYPNDAESDAYLGCNYYGGSMRFAISGDQDDWFYLRLYDDPNTPEYEGNGIPNDEKGAWVCPFMLDPKHPDNIWTALANVYRRPYDAQMVKDWEKLADLPTGLTPHFFEEMDLSWGDTNRNLYIGYARKDGDGIFHSGIYRFDIGDGTGGVTNRVDLTLPRTGYIGAIKCDPSNNARIWLVYSDFFLAPADQPRIYVSDNRGDTWTDKTANFPQSLPASAIFVDPNNPNTVILGTDLGCYRTDDGGASWYTFNDGLPNVVVSDFAYFAPTRLLRAGTYGRGMWETNLDGGLAGNPTILVEPTSLTFDVPDPGLESSSLGSLVVGDHPGLTLSSDRPGQTSLSDAALAANVTIVSEGFEGSFPGSFARFGNPTWGIDDFEKHSGAQSVWCARDGSNGVDPQFFFYPNSCASEFVIGPIDLSDATAASLSFYAWIKTEPNFDFFDLVVSTSANFIPFGEYPLSGDSGGWVLVNLDFSNVQNLGNLLGQSTVYIDFAFLSDSAVVSDGVWIDDILIQKTTATQTLPAPTGVTATTNLTDRVSVTWNAVTGATEYQVWRNTGTDNPGTAAAISGWQSVPNIQPTVSYEDLTAQPGTTYYYYVKARNATTESVLSAGAAGSIPGITVPSQNITVSNSGNGALRVTGITKQNNSAWLSVTPPSNYPVTIAPNTAAIFQVNVNPNGVARGIYSDRLLIANNVAGQSPYPSGVFVTMNNGTFLSPKVADYILGKGALPPGADANTDGQVNVGDVVKLINNNN